MKTAKKISFGLALASVLAMVFFALVPKKASADTTPTKADLTSATYKFQDGANITGTFKFSSAPIIFTDSNSSDSTRNYTPPTDILCDPGDIPNQNGLNGKMKFGINISDTADLTKATVPAQVKLDFYVGSNCDPKNAVLANISIDNSSQLGATDFQWDNDQIKTLNGTSNSETLSLMQNTNNLVYTSFGDSCGSGDVILLDKAGGNTGKLYTMSQIVIAPRGGGSTQNLSNYPAIAPYFDASKCHVDSGPKNITIAGQFGKDATGGAGTTTATGDSCALDSGGFSLAWFMCPLLQAANDLVNGSSGHGGLLGMFEDQLSFNVNRDLGVVGGGGNQVQTTWSLIKNIASAILVILMLLMVFSQAISAGPFDAYTIRKILPRLVAAVILMQLSWYIVAFVVDLVDDIGNSLFDLLYAPFGGANQLDLGHLLSHANIGTGQAIIIDFVGLVGGVVLGLASLPTVLFLAFAAIVALFTALIVLIFRKIIIIFCLIFAPLAILAWILPGTQRYWKLWYDNFIKVLMMFPLIVGLIAAGHIFAYVVGTQGNGTFLNLIFIMVGVFGPLFVLPKTYKWGGQALTMAGGAIHNVGSQIQKRSEGGIRGFGERQQGKWATAYDPQASLRRRTVSRIASGHILPTKRSQRLAIAAGDKWSQERDEEALALIKRKGEKVMTDGYSTYERDGNGELQKASMENGKYRTYKTNEAGKYVNANGHEVENKKDAQIVLTDEFSREHGVREVTTNEAEAIVKPLKGVQAMKQMWVDLAENGRDDHEKKMAIRQLTATSSWPEVQGSFTSTGKRVIDTAAWAKSIATSPEDYPRILRSRVDAAPHIVDRAEKISGEWGYTADTVETRNVRSALRVDYAIENQMSNEDFQTQSEGFWQEAARIASYDGDDQHMKDLAAHISQTLKLRFDAIQQAGPTAVQSMLGHLVGGSIQGEVNTVLAAQGVKIEDYMPGRRNTPPTPQPQQNPNPTQPGNQTGANDDGTTDLGTIDHNDDNPPT